MMKPGSLWARNRKMSFVALCLALGTALAAGQSTTDPLKSGFENPPESAKPRVWWHWMNGNITKEGIKLDLEWMHRAGLGGFQNFDASLMTPQVVDKRLAYMTPEWKDAFKSRHPSGRPAGPGGSHRRLAGLERDRRAVGAGQRGHEEICVERDSRRGRQAVYRNPRPSARQHRGLPEPACRRPGRHAGRGIQTAGVLR